MMSLLGRQPTVSIALHVWLGLCLSAICGCGAGVAPLSVSIPALATEDLASPCTYDLILHDPAYEINSQYKVRGVFVIYERGDSSLIYQDQAVQQTAFAQQYAIVWAHECDARSTGDLQPDASQGPGRTLFAALSAFANLTGHSELATSNMVLYGFSAAGVLTATMEKTYPERITGAITYAAGSEYLDLDHVAVSAAAASLPTLILANANDLNSGTYRSYSYFKRGRALSASWAFAVQNNTTHCCNLSTAIIILPWLQAVMSSNESSSVPGAASLLTTSASSNSNSNFICTPNGFIDDQNDPNCSFTTASVGLPSSTSETGGWLPSQASQTAWLAWVTNPGTN